MSSSPKAQKIDYIPSMIGSRSYPSPYTARAVAANGDWLRAQCQSPRCAHSRQIDPRELVDAGHGDVSLWTVEKRLKCTECGRVGAKVEVVV